MGTDLGGLDRVAANERRFLGLVKSHASDSLIVLQCECTHSSCDERIELTPAQYEPIRSSGARYAVSPHEAHVASADRVIGRRSSHWVVERETTVEMVDFYGAEPRTIASELNARTRGTPTDDEDPVRPA